MPHAGAQSHHDERMNIFILILGSGFFERMALFLGEVNDAGVVLLETPDTCR